MRRPRLAVLESLSAVAVEGRQEALLADAAVHIRDNRIPGTCCTRAREVLRGRRYRYTRFMLQHEKSEIDCSASAKVTAVMIELGERKEIDVKIEIQNVTSR